MSERIVDNPGNHGWVEVNGKWVWGSSGGSGGGSIQDGDTDGQITTWSGTEWTPEGAVVVSGGNVGIGVPSPNRVLQTDGSQVDFSRNGKKFEINPNSGNADTHSTIMTSAGMGLSFDQASFGKMMHIDASGNTTCTGSFTAGSGGGQSISLTPARLRFERDGWNYIQADGGANAGLAMATGSPSTTRLQIDADGKVSMAKGNLTLDNDGSSGYVQSRVKLEAVEAGRGAGVFCQSKGDSSEWYAGTAYGATNEFVVCHQASSPYNESSADVSNAVLRVSPSGLNVIGGLYVNGSEVGSGGGNYVPLSGNSTISGTLTATDFIATSDERLKDDISPLPVGLIDDIKPVQWNWKDGSGKSAGVIAQQLQAIGLDDFVNEDADGNLGVNYNALVGVLLAEVISLKAEVESLK
jgi:hypothetical protein